MKRPLPLREVWQTERGLSLMLVFLVLSLFVGAPLVAAGTVGPYLFDVLFSLLMVSGVVAVSQRKILRFTVSALAIATLVVRWWSYGARGTTSLLLGDALSIVSLSVLVAFVLVQVFREGPVTGYRIQGAIVVYLLLGLIFSSAYEIVERAVPDSFSYSSPGAAGSGINFRLTHGLVYYSFVTLTTLGYGDITPVHPVARSLAVAEALIGQLYPAILIARLVSLEIESRRRP
jgi:hypothetical protein